GGESPTSCRPKVLSRLPSACQRMTTRSPYAGLVSTRVTTPPETPAATTYSFPPILATPTGSTWLYLLRLLLMPAPLGSLSVISRPGRAWATDGTPSPNNGSYSPSALMRRSPNCTYGEFSKELYDAVGSRIVPSGSRNGVALEGTGIGSGRPADGSKMTPTSSRKPLSTAA